MELSENKLYEKFCALPSDVQHWMVGYFEKTKEKNLEEIWSTLLKCAEYDIYYLDSTSFYNLKKAVLLYENARVHTRTVI